MITLTYLEVILVVVLFHFIVLLVYFYTKADKSAYEAKKKENEIIVKNLLLQSRQDNELFTTIILRLAFAMRKINQCEHDRGKLLKSISIFFYSFKDIAERFDQILSNKQKRDELIEFIDNDLNNYLTNETSKLDNDKFFDLVNDSKQL